MQGTATRLFSQAFKSTNKMSAPQVPTIQTLVERNKNYVPTHKPFPHLMGDDGKPRPNPGVLIVTCVDPRIHPEQFLHFSGQFMGDEKPVLRMCLTGDPSESRSN
jgi:hypothetical protein